MFSNNSNAFYGIILRGIGKECYRLIISLIRIRINRKTINIRGWIRLIIYHTASNLLHLASPEKIEMNSPSPAGFLLLGFLFALMLFISLVSQLKNKLNLNSDYPFGCPPLIWPLINSKTWWWIESSLLLGIILFVFTPVGASIYSKLFGINYLPFWVLIIGSIGRFFIEKWGTQNVEISSDLSSHGSASWATENQIKNANLFIEEGFTLGYVKGKPIRTNGEGNLLTVAPAGSGKGTCTVIPNLLESQNPMIVMDLKGENYNLTAKQRQKLGHQIVRLDPFGVCGPQGDSFNPLSFTSKDDIHVNDFAIELAEMMILPNPRDTNPHWDERAKDFLRVFILYIICDAPESKKNLSHLRALITQPPEILSLMLKVMSESTGAGGLISRGAALIKSTNPVERSSIISCMHRHTAFLDSPAVCDILASNSFDPNKLFKDGLITIYLILPHNKTNSYNRLLRLWISSLIGVVTRQGIAPRTRPRICFMLDEMAQLGRMEPIVSAITLLRGYGFTIWSIIQDINQLKTLYPNDEWRTILSNSKYRMFSCVTENETAEYISTALGDTTLSYNLASFGQSNSHNNGWSSTSSSAPGSNSSGYNSGSQIGSSSNSAEQRVSRKLLDAAEIMKLQYEDQILIIPGMNPIFSQKVDYFNNPKLKKLTNNSFN